jgi:two-component system C4-dicarboxylate transport response regulator DctD
LRVLQFREVERVGGTRPIKVDIRILSASNRGLHREAADRRFRQDLVFRLEVLHMHMPAVHERRQDISVLAEHFASAAATRSRRGPVSLSPAALPRLVALIGWPGE